MNHLKVGFSMMSEVSHQSQEVGQSVPLATVQIFPKLESLQNKNIEAQQTIL